MLQKFFATNNGIAGVVKTVPRETPSAKDLPMQFKIALTSDIPPKTTENLETLFHETQNLQYAFDEKPHAGKVQGAAFERYRHLPTQRKEQCGCVRPFL